MHSTFITLQDASPDFHRGYYIISTKRKDDTGQYKFYMNVANVQDTVVNSGNFWLPWGDEIVPNVYVTLIGAGSAKLSSKKKAVKNCKGKDADCVMAEYARQKHDDKEEVVAQIFLTG